MFELVQHPSKEPSIIRFERERLGLLLVEHSEALNWRYMNEVDGVLVQTSSSSQATEVLKQIRSHQNKVVALMPVFVHESVPRSHQISHLFDGIYSEVERVLRLQDLKTIQENLKKIHQGVHQLDYELSLIQLALQFFYTRNKGVTPKLSRKSKIGFSYPFFSTLIKNEESMLIPKLLNRFHKEGYFKKQVLDYVQTCNKCSGGYLNYRESCPKCSSTDLTAHDLIHHFVCAHIAPEEEFKKEDSLECPKCDRTLRHIGIDYDKPSSMYTCNCCNHQFQNATVKALCVDCGHDNDLTQLKSLDISEYHLSAMGEHAAIHGIRKDQQQVTTSKPNIISEQVFELFRTQEMERLKVSEHQSWEGSIRLNMELMDRFHPEQQVLIQNEVLAIVSEYLTKSDVISTPNSFWYRFLLMDKEAAHADQVTQLIQTNVTKLISDGINAEMDYVETLLTSLRME